MVDVSILVCSVLSRHDTFLPKIQKQLHDQYTSLSEADQERVEVLILSDNKRMILGDKRNKMLELAQGKYIVFVDDDDRISNDYIQQLLDASKHGTDSIVFRAEVSLNGERPKLCYYSKDNKVDFNNASGYHRIPNHICCVKKELALKSKFPSVLYGEDANYSKNLLPHLKTERKINKVLYYYDYNDNTTETQAWRRAGNKAAKQQAIVDVVMLSKAVDKQTIQMTQKAIDSCYYGSNGLPINIIVIENGSPIRYARATTLYKPEAFNYNAFANTAAGLGKAEWIMVANNDLEFTDGWLHNLLQAKNDVVSPHEPSDPRQKGIIANVSGFQCGKHLSGWCFMIKRQLWEDIGKFDTDVSFWCSDDVVIEQVKAKGVTPMLVKDAIVKHLPSTTLNREPRGKQADMKWRNVYIFNKKYKKNKFVTHPEYTAWLKANKDKVEA